MAFDSTEFDNDIAEAIADLPATFVDGSATLNVAATVIEESEQILLGGVEGRAKLAVTLRVSAYPPGYSGPIAGRLVSVNGHPYRVFSVTKNPNGVWLDAILGERFEQR